MLIECRRIVGRHEGQGIIKNKQFMALYGLCYRSTPVSEYEQTHIVIVTGRHGTTDCILVTGDGDVNSMRAWHLLIVEFRLDWLFSYLLLCCQQMDVSTRIHFPHFVGSFLRSALFRCIQWTAWVSPWLGVVQQQQQQCNRSTNTSAHPTVIRLTSVISHARQALAKFTHNHFLMESIFSAAAPARTRFFPVSHQFLKLFCFYDGNVLLLLLPHTQCSMQLP